MNAHERERRVESASAEQIAADRQFVADFERHYALDVAAMRKEANRLVRRNVPKLGVTAVVIGLFPILCSKDPTLALLVFVFGAGGLTTNWSREAHRKANRRLEFAADPRLVGVLARYCGSRDPAVSAAAETGLSRVLPLVRPRHRHLIDSIAMKGLLRLLFQARNADLIPLVVRALEHVGNEDAAKAVERLTHPYEWPVGPRRSQVAFDEIIETARTYLPYIQRRAELTEQSENLVRAADGPMDSALLRPAASASEPLEQLVRPSGFDTQDE